MVKKMGHLIIYTQAHRLALEDFVKQQREKNTKQEQQIITQGERGALYYARFQRAYMDIDDLARLLERIAVQRHPVYGRSPKLTALALEREEIRMNNITELSKYLNEYNLLHLEGYIAFRMAEYHYKLDMIMYGIIKKMKLVEA